MALRTAGLRKWSENYFEVSGRMGEDLDPDPKQEDEQSGPNNPPKRLPKHMKKGKWYHQFERNKKL